MTKFNKAELRDKIYACWLGKNIGGTLGTPFEGKREVLDVTGFNSEPGNPRPTTTSTYSSFGCLPSWNAAET